MIVIGSDVLQQWNYRPTDGSPRKTCRDVLKRTWKVLVCPKKVDISGIARQGKLVATGSSCFSWKMAAKQCARVCVRVCLLVHDLSWHASFSLVTVADHVTAVDDNSRWCMGVNHGGTGEDEPPSLQEFGVGDANANCPSQIWSCFENFNHQTACITIQWEVANCVILTEYLLFPKSTSSTSTRSQLHP